MTVSELRRSPLAGYPFAAADGVRFAEIPFLTMLNLRVDPTRAEPIERRLGGTLPGPGMVATIGDRAVLWLGPDEWLLVAPDGDRPELSPGDRPDPALDNAAWSIVDVSANRTTIELRGPLARDVLDQGCTLDLHPRAFHTGQCAQTNLAKAHVILWQFADEPGYRLMVRSSFAKYLADWLNDTVAS